MAAGVIRVPGSFCLSAPPSSVSVVYILLVLNGYSKSQVGKIRKEDGILFQESRTFPNTTGRLPLQLTVQHYIASPALGGWKWFQLDTLLPLFKKQGSGSEDKQGCGFQEGSKLVESAALLFQTFAQNIS